MIVGASGYYDVLVFKSLANKLLYSFSVVVPTEEIHPTALDLVHKRLFIAARDKLYSIDLHKTYPANAVVLSDSHMVSRSRLPISTTMLNFRDGLLLAVGENFQHIVFEQMSM